MIANLWAKVVGIYEIKTVWEKPGNVMISELPDSLGKKKNPYSLQVRCQKPNEIINGLQRLNL